MQDLDLISRYVLAVIHVENPVGPMSVPFSLQINHTLQSSQQSLACLISKKSCQIIKYIEKIISQLILYGLSFSAIENNANIDVGIDIP